MQDHRAAGPQVDLGAGVAEPSAEMLSLGDQLPHALDGRVDDGLSLDLVGNHVNLPEVVVSPQGYTSSERCNPGLHVEPRV